MDRRILIVGLVMVAMVAARPSAKTFLKNALAKTDSEVDFDKLTAEAIAAGPVKKEDLQAFVGGFKTDIADVVKRFGDAEKEASEASDDVVKILNDVSKSIEKIGEDYKHVGHDAAKLAYRTYVLGFDKEPVCDKDDKDFKECQYKQFGVLSLEVLSANQELENNITPDDICTALDREGLATGGAGGFKKTGRDAEIKAALKKDIECLKRQLNSVSKLLTPAEDNGDAKAKKEFVQTLLLMQSLGDQVEHIDLAVGIIIHMLEGGDGPGGYIPAEMQEAMSEFDQENFNFKALLRNLVGGEAKDSSVVVEDESASSVSTSDGSDDDLSDVDSFTSTERKRGAKVAGLVKQLIRALGKYGKKHF